MPIPPPSPPPPMQRRHAGHDAPLVLAELPRETVFDPDAGRDGRIDLLSCGPVREACPKCHTGPLRLILRQELVRCEHLFCAHCGSCFTAHYPDGASALSV